MQVGAVPGYTTGHVEQPGTMNNTYNNYGSTRTGTVYGPANMSNMPMKMANQSNFLSKTSAQGLGATSLVTTLSCAAPVVSCSLPTLFCYMDTALCNSGLAICNE